jgi:sortase (surface protein transpeptidase)
MVRCRRPPTRTPSAGFRLGHALASQVTPCSTGYVDWGGHLRVFGLLNALQPGDDLQITDADGDTLTYNVLWVQLYPADGAPVEQIFRQTGDEELTLMTCGGAFDHWTHTYTGRLVVRAVRAP